MLVGQEEGDIYLAWAGSVSLASPETANNVAEYTGLIWGLHAVVLDTIASVHVVGDSKLIITQMQGHHRHAVATYSVVRDCAALGG